MGGPDQVSTEGILYPLSILWRFVFLLSDQQNYNLLILNFPLFSNKTSFSVRLLLADLLYNMLRTGSKILLDVFAFDGHSKNA